LLASCVRMAKLARQARSYRGGRVLNMQKRRGPFRGAAALFFVERLASKLAPTGCRVLDMQKRRGPFRRAAALFFVEKLARQARSYRGAGC